MLKAQQPEKPAVSRRQYLRECEEHSIKHHAVAIMMAVIVLYSLLQELVPFLDLPELAITFPKIPLTWAVIVCLLVALLLAIEGGYRRLEQELNDKEKAENKIQALEIENEKRVREVGIHISILEKAKAHVHELEAELARRNCSEEWKYLAAQFKDTDIVVTAAWYEDKGEETWSIRPGDKQGRDYESLCELAGNMLARSPKVSAALSERGEERPVLFGSINNLPGACRRACLHCAAQET